MSNFSNIPISHYKVLSLPSRPEANSVYYVLDKNSNIVEGYITSKNSEPIPLFNVNSNGKVESVTGTGVTGTSTNPVVDIATFISNQLGNLVHLSATDGKLSVNPLVSTDDSIEIIETSTEIQLQLAQTIQDTINGKEDLASKQDSLEFDGTANKYPTVDAVNEAFLRNTKLFARTGVATKNDQFELTVFDVNTIVIKNVDSAVFWNELFDLNAVADDAFKSFTQKTYPLSELVTATGGNINTNPITSDGIYVRYLGYDVNGNVVSSPNNFIENSSIVQLGFTTVIKSGATVSFLGGTAPNARNVFSQPILANLNELDRITTTAATDITINYNIGSPSLKSNPGTITGISINWRGINNPNNTESIDKFSYPGDSTVDFVSLTPLSLTQATPFTLHTLWTESEGGIQINNSFFNTTSQLRDTLVSGAFGVKRVLIGIRGGIFIQESEFATNAGYATIDEAKANVFTHEFTEAIIPPDIVVEIARIVFKKGVTDFSNENEFFIVETAGGAGSGGGISTVGDATTSTKGILKLTNDLGGTADLPTTPTALHITGDESKNGSLAVASLSNVALQGSSTTNIGVLANTFSSLQPGLIAKNSSTGDIAWFKDNTDNTVARILQNGNIVSTKFVTTGGTSSQFVKGDGSLDSSTYLTSSSLGLGSLTNNQHIKWNGSTFVNSIISDDGTDGFISGNLTFGTSKGFILNQSGTNRNIKIYNASPVDNLAQSNFYPSIGTNVGTTLNIIPKGTGLNASTKAQYNVFNTDFIADSVNYELLLCKAGGTTFDFVTGKFGTGTIRPLRLSAGYADGSTNPNQLWLYSSGNVGVGTASDDGLNKLQVNGTTSISNSMGVGIAPASTNALTAKQLSSAGGNYAAQFLDNSNNPIVQISAAGLLTNNISAIGAATITIQGNTGLTLSHFNCNGTNRMILGSQNGMSVAATGHNKSWVSVSPILNVQVGSSGNAWNLLGVDSSVDMTNTTTSILRGLYINPTITNLGGNKYYGLQVSSGGAYINTSTPDASAALQTDSTTQGFLPPRMTLAQGTSISSPTTGLIRYQTDGSDGLYVKKASAWDKVMTYGDIIKTRKDVTGTTYTLLASDFDKVLYCTNASGCAITIPSGLTTNQEYEVIQYTATAVSYTASGTTLRYPSWAVASHAEQYSRVVITYLDTETYQLSGDLLMI